MRSVLLFLLQVFVIFPAGIASRVAGAVWGVVFPPMAPFVDHIARKYRWAAMLLVVLPLSFVLRQFMWLREAVYLRFFVDASPAGHAERVARVVADVAARMARPASDRRKMCTARAPWQNLSTRFADYKKSSDCIFVGDLRAVVRLNAPGSGFGEHATVTLEPQVDVGAATRWLLPRGYMLATTLEIEEATVGGLACAVGMTTASHRYGLLQETVVEYEIVLGDGTLVRARRDNDHADLWHAFPWSHGSLGLLVGLTLRVVPVTSHVRLDYTPVRGQAAYCEKIRAVSLRADPADFVEATVYSRDECVVMEASFVPDAEVDASRVNNLGWWFKPWFFTHVRDVILAGCPACAAAGSGDGSSDGSSSASSVVGETVAEFIPTYQYIMRHDRGIFWTLRDQLPEALGNHVAFRWCLGWLNPPKVTFLKLPATPRIRREMMCERVYQDIVLPLRTMEEAINLSDELFGIWPVLVYPSRVYDHGDEYRAGQFPRPLKSDLVPGTNYAMYYDLGVYGIPAMSVDAETQTPAEQAIAQGRAVGAMRTIEKFTRDNQGAPFLYANTFMDREEFGDTFDLALYERVREKYEAAEHFPHLFDKTSGCQALDFVEIERQGEEAAAAAAGAKAKTKTQ